jgi:hypothetical protein
VKLIRAVEAPYTLATLEDGTQQAINHYRVKLKNQSFDPQTVSIELHTGATDGVEIVAPTFPATIEGGGDAEHHVFFKFPATLTHGTGNYIVTLHIRGVSERGTETNGERVTLVGPFSATE